MLSMIMITAITAVALPQLRITTLSMLRSISLTYMVGVFILMQSSLITNALYLFSDTVTIDTMGTYLMVAALMIVITVLSFYTSRSISTSGTPYTIVLLVMIMLVRSLLYGYK